MLTPTLSLLKDAETGQYAVGAFNIYNLEGVKAVINAAEQNHSPAMLQLHPSALAYGGEPLIALCLTAARRASVPIAVHLDHSSSAEHIRMALANGVASIMADGSALPYAQNTQFTHTMTALAHGYYAAVEAELGRLTGTEDGLTVAEYEAQLTDPAQAASFVAQTGIDALAVCIGNVHGVYRTEPQLDFERLAAIRAAVTVPLVLHGASGLPEAQVQQAISLGVRKFNVNTEVRAAYVETLRTHLANAQVPDLPDLLDLMRGGVAAMQAVVTAKLILFGSTDRA